MGFQPSGGTGWKSEGRCSHSYHGDKPIPRPVGKNSRINLDPENRHSGIPIHNSGIERLRTLNKAYCSINHCHSLRSTRPSKLTVAPFSCQSIPRLELCDALLTAELYEQVNQAIKLPATVHFFVYIVDIRCFQMLV